MNNYKEKTNFNNILLIFLGVFVILYFFFLGNIGLLDVDEPRYAEAGREMLESWNWIVPYFNYTVRYDKPVFFYWLEAASMAIFGVNEFSARLPSALTALLCTYFLFQFLNTFFGITCALIGSLILMSSLEFAALARFSITDMTLASFISCAIFCFFLGYDQILNSHKIFKFQIREFSGWYILAFFFLALAFLTKGPVSIVLIGAVFIPFFWWIGKLEYFLMNKSFWFGFVLFLVLVLPWYIAVHSATNGDFTSVFFGLHNFERYTKVVSGHKGNYFYFIPVVLIGFLPWTFFLPQAIASIFKRGLQGLQKSSKEQVPWFCIWWFLIVFIFYSTSKTKLLTYILPLFPALSIIVSVWLNGLIKKRVGDVGLAIGLGLFFILTLALAYIVMFKLNIILPREIKNLKLDFQILLLSFVLFVGVSMAWASSLKDAGLTFSIVLTTFLILYFSCITVILPKVDKHSQYTLRHFAKSFPKNVEIAEYQIVKPSLIFYSKRKVKRYESLKKLQERINTNRRFAFVTKKALIQNVSLENVYKFDEDSRFIFYTNYPTQKRTENLGSERTKGIKDPEVKQ